MGGAEGWCREPPCFGRPSLPGRRAVQALPFREGRLAHLASLSLLSPSCPASRGTHWGPPDLGAGVKKKRKKKKEKRSLRVLQDRGDNPQSLGRVGGESEEPGCENGKLEGGLLQRTHAPPACRPHPFSAGSHSPLNRVASSEQDLMGLLLSPQKKSLSEQARCNFLSFVKAASCFPSFIAL